LNRGSRPSELLKSLSVTFWQRCAVVQGVKLGRPKIDSATERKVRQHGANGVGILKVARSLAIGTSPTVTARLTPGRWTFHFKNFNHAPRAGIEVCFPQAQALPEHTAKAMSQRRSGSRSPSFAKPRTVLAIALRDGMTTPQLCRAWMAVSNAIPREALINAAMRSFAA
jgi:hypothetical protein